MSDIDVPEEPTETVFQDMLVEPKVDNPDMIEIYSWLWAVIAAFCSWLFAVLTAFFSKKHTTSEYKNKQMNNVSYLSTTSP